MKRIHIVTMACAFAAGCADLAVQESATDCDCGSSYRSRVSRKDMKIAKLFGIDDQVLSDTNRFSKAETPHVYHITLPEPVAECTQATVFLNGVLRRRSDKLSLRSVELKRTLRDEAGDRGLEDEYQSTCDCVAHMLGVESLAVRLDKPKKNFRGRLPMPGWGLQSCTSFDLADGQSISVRAIDALYVKRGDSYVLNSPAAIEVDFTYNPSLFRDIGEDDVVVTHGKTTNVVRSIELGPDCSDRLSAEMSDKMLKSSRRKKEDEANRLWKDAEAYFKGKDGREKDWAKSRELYLKAGEMFSTHASGGRLAELGTFYDLKQGPFEQDYKEAARWYRKGVDFGNCWCMGKLSILYRNGTGVEKSVTNALKYARMAADRKLGHYLAEHYELGLGVDKDLKKAFDLRKSEAEWLNPIWDRGGPACRVGELYEKGIGTETNSAEAVKWYRKASEQGSKKAKDRLEKLGHL